MINWYRELNAYRVSKGLAPENVPEQYRSESTAVAGSANDEDTPDVEDDDDASDDKDEPTPPPVAPTPVSKRFKAINHKDTPAKASPAKGSPVAPQSSSKRKRGAPSANGN